MFAIDFNLAEVSGNCKEWRLYDTTGDGTTGWGGSNPGREADSTITFYILQNKFTVGYLITLTTVAGEITAFTITDPAGTVVDWFDTLTDVVAFTTDPLLYFTITTAMLGLTDDDNFESTGYYFEENITIATVTYTADANQLIMCSHCCCMQKEQAKLKDCNCNGTNKRLDDMMWATMLTDAAPIAMNDGNVTEAIDMLDKAKAICGGKCGTC